MFQPHFPNATATAIIEGLAIAGYDNKESQWNVTFLRNCGHYPRLTIRKVDRQSGEVINVIKTYEIQEDDSISIMASGSQITDWRFEGPGEFDKKTANPQDLRWMMNIKQLSQAKVERMNPPKVSTNSLTISDGCFYTSVLTKGTYRMQWVNSQNTVTFNEELGITGRTFGSDFVADSVTITINGNDSFSEEFNFEEDARYEMIFDNTCVGEEQPSLDGETDFRFYYNVFNPNDGRVEIFPNNPAGSMTENTSDIARSTTEASADSLYSEQDPKEPACQSIVEDPYGSIP